MDLNFTDLYILHQGLPNYSTIEFIEDEAAKVIVQKYHMIVFTNQGDVFGHLSFGGNLLDLLHNTKYSAEDVEIELISQINTYINELNGLEYQLKVEFYEHPERFEEIMVIDFFFNGILVTTIVD